MSGNSNIYYIDKHKASNRVYKLTDKKLEPRFGLTDSNGQAFKREDIFILLDQFDEQWIATKYDIENRFETLDPKVAQILYDK